MNPKAALSKRNRALLVELVRTDFKLRYQGSLLGYAWSLLRPLLMFLILYVVFVKVFPLGKGIPHYPVYLLLGIVIWNFFVEMTMRSLTTIVERGDLIRKIRIPRWIIIFSSSIAAVINLLLNLVVVAIFMVLNHVGLMQSIVWLPLILVEVYALALGASLFLSAAYVKYRDVSYIWEVVTQAAFYLTPIIYPLSRVTNVTLKKLIFLNPMAQSIQDARYATITHQSQTISAVYTSPLLKLTPYLICVVLLAGGLLYFKSRARYFAENI